MNLNTLLKSLKESAEQEIRGKLTGQALAAKKRATELYNKQKATLEGIQSQLKRNIKNVAVAQQTAEMKLVQQIKLSIRYSYVGGLYISLLF